MKLTTIVLPSGHVLPNYPNLHALPTTTSDMDRYKSERRFVKVLNPVFDSKQTCSTPETRKYCSAFAASHPTVSTTSISAIMAISRFCLLMEIKASMALDKELGIHAQDDWNNLFSPSSKLPLSVRVSKSTPSHAALDNWVDELAVDQALVTSNELTKAKAVTLQEDGAPDGTSVQLVNWWSTKMKDKKARDGGVKSFLCGVSKTGKKADDIAEGVNHTLKNTFALPATFKLFSITVDSGGGTPESLFNALRKKGLISENGSGNSCIEHDDMSCFRLPLHHYIGQGGLGNRNAVQSLHAVWDLYMQYEKEAPGTWTNMLKTVWERLYNQRPVPKVLMKAVQEPLITRWWTIGCLAGFLDTYWEVIFKMAKAAIVYSNTDQALNKIASGLVSEMQERVIKADVSFIATYSKLCLEPNLLWDQKVDPNIGEHGFLAFHRLVKFFLDLSRLNDLRKNWRLHPGFQKYVGILEEETDKDNKEMIESTPDGFFDCAIAQHRKHNIRYATTVLLLQAAFGEHETGKHVADLLLGKPMIVNDTNKHFKSPLHLTSINIEDWISFLSKETQPAIVSIRNSTLVKMMKPSLQLILAVND